MSEIELGEALETIIDHRGKTPRKLGGDFTESGVPVASAQLVRGGRLWLEEARYVSDELYRRWMPVKTCKHDVLLTSEAPLGRVALVPDDRPLVLGQRIFGLRGKAGMLDSRFLFYAFQTKAMQASLRARATGTTVIGIRQSELLKVRLRVPSYSVQRRIAALLGTLDDKIALNDRIVGTLRELCQTQTKAVAGNAPRLPLAEVASITMGSSPPGETYNEERVGLPFYQGARDFGLFFPSQRVWCRDPVRVAEPGATLVSVRAPVGRINLAAELCCIGRGLAALASKIGTPSVLFYTLIADPHIWAPFEGEGTVFSSMNKRQLEQLPIPTLPLEAAQRLEASLAPLTAQVRAAVDETESLSRLRDNLLPGLMSGKIRVRDAEQAVEAAT